MIIFKVTKFINDNTMQQINNYEKDNILNKHEH